MSIFNEIYITKDPVDDLFNSLTSEERVFTYLMFRASLPFNKIYRDQNHRHNNEIIELFEFLFDNKDKIFMFLLEDIKVYLVYLWTNHGVYFLKDQSDNKRTPGKLGLKYLTEDNLDQLLQNLNYSKEYKHLFLTIFNNYIDPVMVVPGSIELSGNNYYEKGFTEQMYESMPANVKNRINAYFTLKPPHYVYYSMEGKYAEELTVSVCWLKKALDHAKLYPNAFDQHIVNSLQYLIEYFEGGDEEKFRQYSIEWLKTKSRLDYNLGYIENYHDPKLVRGEAGGEITIKTTNMEKLNPILLDMESRLPTCKEYKRDIKNATTVNVSMNKILYSSGDYGPIQIVAAYNLPNYPDIQAEYGSKQILYKMMDPVKLNPKVWDQLVKDEDIYNDLWDLQVLLHELSHGTGKLHLHTTETGETIPVTTENLTKLVGKDFSALEELRAEISALYLSLAEMDILNKQGLYKNWYNQLGEKKLRNYCIMEMTRHIFRRLIPQGDDMKEIKGAHAKANFIITNYLLEGGGIEITDEIKNIDNEDFHILGIEVTDFNKAFSSTVKLLQLVQEIKSTGNGKKCDELFAKYTTYPITIEKAKEYRKYVMDINKKLNGTVKATARLYLNFVPIIKDDQLVDISIGEDQNVFNQNLHYNKLILSTTY
jgi:hypothetical protein